MNNPQVDFEPIGRRIGCAAGETLLAAAQQAGVMLNAVCGGEGVCGRCLVRIMDGKVSPPTISEEDELSEAQLAEGWRLACQAEIIADVRLHVPPESLASMQRTQTEGESVDVEVGPAVKAYQVKLDPPTLHDLRSDAERLRAALDLTTLHIPNAVLRRLSNDLRAESFNLTLLVNHAAPEGPRLVGVRPAGTALLGFAVDVGTTKLAGYLVDLSSGETLASAGAMNPQIAYGEDVLSRIGHAISHPNGIQQMQAALLEALNSMAGKLSAEAGCKPEDIADAVVVGNTAMHHLFLGLPVRQLGLAPYIAAESASLDLPAAEIGLELAPGALVHLLPNIAGFVGADHVSMLLASEMAESEGVVLGLDIGTNTEVSLMARGRHFSCSTASGPAFEGAHIRFGMRAAPGAIEKVLIQGEQLWLQTIDHLPPVGLCGSGILDLVAQLRQAGLLTFRGSFDQNQTHTRMRKGDHGPEFVIVTASENDGKEITFTRSDVSEIQLAKAAIRAGVDILLQKAGISESEIDEVIIAGAFGTYLDVQSGIGLGMFPNLDLTRYKQVGNAAGAGARLALLSMEQRQKAVRIADQIEYVELTAEDSFSSRFAKNLILP